MMDHQITCPVCESGSDLEFVEQRMSLEMGWCVTVRIACMTCNHEWELSVWGNEAGMWVEDPVLRSCPIHETCPVHRGRDARQSEEA
jgi:hypothetical protein